MRLASDASSVTRRWRRLSMPERDGAPEIHQTALNVVDCYLGTRPSRGRSPELPQTVLAPQARNPTVHQVFHWPPVLKFPR